MRETALSAERTMPWTEQAQEGSAQQRPLGRERGASMATTSGWVSWIAWRMSASVLTIRDSAVRLSSMMARPDLLRSEPLGSRPREIKGGLGLRGRPNIECSGLGGQSSRVEVSPSGRPSSRALSRRRIILPLRVLGRLSMKSISRGAMPEESLLRAKRMSSRRRASVGS